MRDTELTPQEIDAKLAALEEPQEEVEVEPEEEVVEEVVESAPTPDDTDDDEPAESAGDENEEDETTDGEEGLIQATMAERKRRQAAEDKLNKLQESLDQLQETVKSSQQPRTLEDAYERDAKGVTDNINVNIAQAVEQNDTLEAERLRDLKETLRTQSRQKQNNQQQTQQKQTEISTALFSNIPDWSAEKAKILTDYAIEHLEFTDADLTEKTNIDKHGVDAIKEIVRINKLYKKAQIPSKAAKKKVKKATSVEKSGTQSKKAVADAQGLISKARKSGSTEDWMDVIEKRLG